MMTFQPASEVVQVITKAVSFHCESCRLFGMLHLPPDHVLRHKTGIILLNPGPTDRSGPHRLYIKLAVKLAAQGYPVLRFDARGVGDSEGEWREDIEGATILNIWKEIHQGIWIPDAQAAIEFLCQAVPEVGRVILGGLCGGAITALLAGAAHPSVAGLLMMGTPLTLGDRVGNVEALPNETIKQETMNFYRKLASPKAWVRFISCQTDVWGIATTLMEYFRRQTNNDRTHHGRQIETNINPAFMEALKAATRHGKRMLFIYAENDYLWHEFKEYLLVPQSPTARLFEVTTIAKANHNMTETNSQERLHEKVTEWLSEHFKSYNITLECNQHP